MSQQNSRSKSNRRSRKPHNKNKSPLPGGNLPVVGGTGANIQTTWQDINWTRKKLFLITCLLGLPYLITIIATYLAGMTIITFVLIGLALFVGILFLIVRWVEHADF
jgi:hypothetical protein